MKPVTPIPVLGVTAGIIGCMQANECIKLLLGIGEPLYGRMLNYDGLSGTWEEIQVKKDENCPVHANLNIATRGKSNGAEFTHFDRKGNAVMVDVSQKQVTSRTAITGAAFW